MLNPELYDRTAHVARATGSAEMREFMILYEQIWFEFLLWFPERDSVPASLNDAPPPCSYPIETARDNVGLAFQSAT